MRLLSDIDVSQKRVFVRADLDVPVKEFTVKSSQYSGATRLTNLKNTIDYLYKQGASKIIIAGHIDRPQKPDPEFSTKQLRFILEQILLRSVYFAQNLEKQVAGYLVLVENLRFFQGEETNDTAFAVKLSSFADIYVNEAFGNCHRNHASMVALPRLLPHAAGLHLEEEVNQLTKLIRGPKKPFVAIIGGAKIETKLPLVSNLSKIADFVLVGGELPVEIKDKQMTFPQNVLVASLADDKKDISEESVKQFSDVITKSQTVVWNGPLGLFEEGHAEGSRKIAGSVIDSGAYSVAGGGETVEFLAKNNLLSHFSFVSSGGGAMLEFLSGKKLLALEALQ